MKAPHRRGFLRLHGLTRVDAGRIRGLALAEGPILLAPYPVPDAFSPDDCARIVALATEGPMREAGLVRGVSDAATRRAEVAWLDDRPDAGWVTDRLVALVVQANRDHFDFAIEDFAESGQAARYGAERQGHFGWHADIGEGPLARRRKLTLVVQLSEPAGYAGGGLELWPHGAAQEAPRALGAAILFPAFVLHRVTPVTAGERFSLTIWAHGPAFR